MLKHAKTVESRLIDEDDKLFCWIYMLILLLNLYHLSNACSKSVIEEQKQRVMIPIKPEKHLYIR